MSRTTRGSVVGTFGTKEVPRARGETVPTPVAGASNSRRRKRRSPRLSRWISPALACWSGELELELKLEVEVELELKVEVELNLEVVKARRTRGADLSCLPLAPSLPRSVSSASPRRRLKRGYFSGATRIPARRAASQTEATRRQKLHRSYSHTEATRKQKLLGAREPERSAEKRRRSRNPSPFGGAARRLPRLLGLPVHRAIVFRGGGRVSRRALRLSARRGRFAVAASKQGLPSLPSHNLAGLTHLFCQPGSSSAPRVVLARGLAFALRCPLSRRRPAPQPRRARQTTGPKRRSRTSVRRLER